MPDLGPNRRSVRPRPVMVQTRGYDPTQPNKTSFLATPKTFSSLDADFIWSGMPVCLDSTGKMVPLTAALLGGDGMTPDQTGFARQDSNRFDVVQSRLAPAISNRSDVELRTAWFDRSAIYKVGDPLTVNSDAELCIATSGDQVIARVSALPRFNGGNPRIGGVAYDYLPKIPAIVGTDGALADDQALMKAWVDAAGNHLGDAAARTALKNAVDGAATGAALVVIHTAWHTAYDGLRQSVSDLHSFEATDNSMITVVPANTKIA